MNKYLFTFWDCYSGVKLRENVMKGQENVINGSPGAWLAGAARINMHPSAYSFMHTYTKARIFIRASMQRGICVVACM